MYSLYCLYNTDNVYTFQKLTYCLWRIYFELLSNSLYNTNWFLLNNLFIAMTGEYIRNKYVSHLPKLYRLLWLSEAT